MDAPAGDALAVGRRRRIVWANFLGLVMQFYDLFVYSLFIVPISEYFHVPTWFSFFIFAVSFCGRAVGSLFFGQIADKLGRRNALVFTVLGYSVATLMTGLSWNVASLLVWRSLTGLFVGGEFVSMSYMMESVPKRSRGLYAGLMGSCAPLGLMLSSLMFLGFGLITGGHAAGDTWRYPFIVGFLPALIALWLRLGVQESEPWERAAQAGKTKATTPILRVFSRRYLGRTLQGAGLVIGLNVAYNGLVFALPTSLHLMRFTGPEIGTLTSLIAIGQIPGAFFSGWLSQVWGRRRALVLTAILGICATPLTAVFWQLPAVPSFGYMLVAATATGLFVGASFAVLYAYLPERYPVEVRATGSAGSFNLAQVVSSWSSPLMAAEFAGSALHFTQGIAVYAVGGYLLTMLLAFAGPETRHVDLETYDEEAELSGATGVPVAP